jgi:3,4-dihydroxy 2-butanone 4-phosphate synthase / GTP cyclohydrolase II
MENAFCTVEEALEELRAGRMVILTDDEDRENEGDLVVAAEFATPEAINFMATHGRGLICLSLTGDQIDKLGLPPMTRDNQAPLRTAFHVSIEAAEGVTTGISAFDRARTVAAAIARDAKPSDVVQPGHVFPLRAREGGVLVRAGQTEGSVDLAKLAGLRPAAVICEIMHDDGTMARLPDLTKFAQKHNLKICSVESLISHRRRHEKLVHCTAETRLPTVHGEFKIKVYETDIEDRQHVALVLGEIFPGDEVLVRVHSECLTGDVFGSLRCDCGSQLDAALQLIAGEGKGVLVYMRQEGRGIGLSNKIRAYALQDQGLDTVEANVHLGFKPDQREYGIGAQILSDIGVTHMRLITNNPNKRVGLVAHNLEVVDRVPLVVPSNVHNQPYLKTKAEKLGHLF